MRLRFTVRRLLFVVALIAVLLTGYRYVQRLRFRAWTNEMAASLESDTADTHRMKAADPWTSEAKKQAHRKAAEWHEQRAALFREAVRRPWIDVPMVKPPSFEPAPAAGWRARAYASGIHAAAELVARVRRQRADKAGAIP
jgi:hypothetical protein